jgi:hypothetical protein
MPDLECRLERSLELQIVAFAALQESLLQAADVFRARPPIARINQTICDEHGNEWVATSHGCGVRFRNASHGIVVDAHSHLDELRGVDAWRLRTFLSSLPTGTRRRFERELAGSSLEMLLESLADRGIVERCEAVGLFRVHQ